MAGGARPAQALFFPEDGDTYRAEDKLLLMADKHTQRAPPARLVQLARRVQAGEALEAPARIRLRRPEFGFKSEAIERDPR